MTNDAKRVLVAFADGSPFGVVDVRRLLECRARKAMRVIRTLLDAELARPTARSRITLYELSPRGRVLGAAFSELRSRADEDE